MPLEAGEAVMSGDIQETIDHGTGVSAGDVVALASGEAVTADTEANEFAGVASETGDTVGLEGAWVAATASGVTQGERLGSGNATGTSSGTFISSSGGPALALSDEGGTWRGMDVPAGYAVVHF